MSTLEEEDTTSPRGMAGKERGIGDVSHRFLKMRNEGCFENGFRVIPVEERGGLS